MFYLSNINYLTAIPKTFGTQCEPQCSQRIHIQQLSVLCVKLSVLCGKNKLCNNHKIRILNTLIRYEKTLYIKL